MGSGVDDPDIFPSNGSVSRRAPSLHGVPSERVPPLRRYHEPLRLPACQPLARLEVRRAIPALRAGLGGISQVPWEPPCAIDVFYDPVETVVPGHSQHCGAADVPRRTSASNKFRLSRLGPSAFHALRTRCLRFADTVRPTRPWARMFFPGPTQDSLPAGGLLYRTGLGTRWVPLRSFSDLPVTSPSPRFTWRARSS